VDAQESGGTSTGCGELERRERQWLAEKATLEEYYEVSARNQRDAELQARDALVALRRENDAQLQLLQAARRALSDLRNRFDLAAASWNDERLRLQTAAEPVSHVRQRSFVDGTGFPDPVQKSITLFHIQCSAM